MDDDEIEERLLQWPLDLNAWQEILFSLQQSTLVHDHHLIHFTAQLPDDQLNLYLPPLLTYWRLTNEARRGYRLACRLYRLTGEHLEIAWICWLTMDTVDRDLVGSSFLVRSEFSETSLLTLCKTGKERRAVRLYYDQSERAEKIATLLGLK